MTCPQSGVLPTVWCDHTRRRRTSTFNPSLSLSPLPLMNLVKILHFPFQLGRKAGGQTKLCCSMPGRRAGSSGFFLRDRLKNHARNKQTLSLIMVGGAPKASLQVAKITERAWSSFHPSARGIDEEEKENEREKRKGKKSMAWQGKAGQGSVNRHAIAMASNSTTSNNAPQVKSPALAFFPYPHAPHALSQNR